MLYKAIFLLALTASSMLFSATAHSYQEVVSLVAAGIRSTILVDLQACTGQSGMPKGYFIPNSMMVVPATSAAKEHVATSDLHFTERAGEPVYEFVRYTFTPDNSVEVYVQWYRAQDFTPVDSARTISCKLGKGVQVLY